MNNITRLYANELGASHVWNENTHDEKRKFKATIAFNRLRYWFRYRQPLVVVESDVHAIRPWMDLPHSAYRYDILALHDHQNGLRSCKHRTGVLEGDSFYSPGSLFFTGVRTNYTLECLRQYTIGRPFAHWLSHQKCISYGSVCPRPFIQTSALSTYN